MHENSFSFAKAKAISKVPTVSMLAAIIGTPVHVTVLCLNLNSLSNDTCDLLFSVERFGLIITSLNPNFSSVSILILYTFSLCSNVLYHWVYLK